MGPVGSPIRDWPETDTFDIFDSHLSPFVHLRPLIAEGQWEVMEELAMAEDAANKGIPQSSCTSHEITGMRISQSELSQSHIERRQRTIHPNPMRNSELPAQRKSSGMRLRHCAERWACPNRRRTRS